MTDAMVPDAFPDATDLLAAEIVLGLLDDGERADAVRRLADDAALAAAVERWQRRFDGWLDDAPLRQHSPQLWDRVAAALPPRAVNDNDADLRRRVSLWRGYGALMTAASLALAALVVLRPADIVPPTNIEAPPPILVATLALPDAGAISLTVDHATNRIVASPVGISPDHGFAHEMWLVPATGTPQSLGVIDIAAPNVLTVNAATILALQSGATIAVSAEPAGGSQQAGPSGPVLTTGQLREI